MSTIRDRYVRLRERIARAATRAGRRPEEIQLVAVSKTVGPDRVREAWEAGCRRFGENRAQELRDKKRVLSDLEIHWHFIGHLQTNKARLVCPGTALIHSVDRLELAEKLNQRAAPHAPQPVLLQVNLTGERQQSGVEPAHLRRLLDDVAALPHLVLEGLMTIGPFTDDEAQIRMIFRRLRQIGETERRAGRPHAPLEQLSMGMTGDFEIAIEEGATIVRVGTALFGDRP